MGRFIVRRLLLSLITLFILLIIVTLIPNIAPGDPARKIAGGTASPERLAAESSAHQGKRDDGEDEGRERKLHVSDPSDEAVHPAPDISGDQA